MTCEVPLPFPVCLWWYNLVGNICWYNSCVAAAIIKGRILSSIFSQFPLPFLFSHCITRSFLLCLGKSGLLSFFPPISSPSSVVAFGLGCCKVKVKCSSEAHFSASLMLTDTRSALPSLQTSSRLSWSYLSSQLSANNSTPGLILVLLYSA